MRNAILTSLGVLAFALGPQTPQPGPGQILVTSIPSGLNVYVERHKEKPKTSLTRTGNLDARPDGVTPYVFDAAPGHYTIAVEQVFAATDPAAPKAPRGCINNFSFSGGSIFWECFKCRIYPDANPELRDEIDPYRRDGNHGVCFHAPDMADAPVKYFRAYAVEKGGAGYTLVARFEKPGAL